ncbi:carboxymuconolactone decarboxylase family protein [Sinomicrobium weinanense]|uniref:Carboxymuconolactone decarboxylase family protein n=1 Tax=Sinomicrobium weinanense TaxID=2842200 RepID=A0A926JR29_9FLAO|nr:carboxymuconolactone decarboxylase family protein [Sinomicrobium weinanense]MBC9795935.1 carboxymuconolactone decarboxylase family protein [Sinomicrobium weinanense]MBU3124686.1 carboxymuconolactone decarboxylase family protein [Sinomicrobium weinanense]
MKSKKRISIEKTMPEAFRAILKLSAQLKKGKLAPELVELLKIRASQLNSCSYCIDMHVDHALKIGVEARKIYALPAWKASHIFSPEERAVLQLTEELTRMTDNGLTDDTYNTIIDLFGEEVASQLIMLIVVINSWNRINVAGKTVYA